MATVTAKPATPPPLICTLTAPDTPVAAGQPVLLRWSLRNAGAGPLDVLVWGTPLERRWLAPWLTVERDGGAPLAYGGASVKRGEPGSADYIRLAPGERREAEVDLSPVFDLAAPGRYRVRPHLVLHDVAIPADAQRPPSPRPRALHAGTAMVCNDVTFEVVAR